MLHALLVSIPPGVTLMLLTALPTGLVVALHWRFRRIVPAERLLPHHDVAGFLVAVVGVLYAVVLGFLVVTGWTAFDNAQQNADAEAGNVGEALGNANQLPPATRAALRDVLARYAFEVRDREWPLLTYGVQDSCARRLLLRARDLVAGAHLTGARASFAESLRDETLRGQALESLRGVSVDRRRRLIDAESHLPIVLYLALAIGGCLVVAFTFLFGVSNQTLQLTMTGLVTASIALLFSLIFLLDYPYSGSYRVTPNAWNLVIENNELSGGPPCDAPPRDRTERAP